MTTADLPARLRAAIDKMERIAREARSDFDHLTVEVVGTRVAVSDMRHVLANNPASVLRRCAADRKIVDEVMSWQHHDDDDPWHACRPDPTLDIACTCGLDQRRDAILRALAEGYGVEVDAPEPPACTCQGRHPWEPHLSTCPQSPDYPPRAGFVEVEG